MRIALVSWYPCLDGRVVGAGVAAQYMKEVLNKLGHQSLVVTGTVSGRVHTGMQVDMVYKHSQMADGLNWFDAVIFVTTSYYGNNKPESSEIVPIVDAVHVPFMYMIHDEREDKIHNHRQFYNANPYCRGMILLDESMDPFIDGDMPRFYTSCWRFIEPTWINLFNSHIKRDVVISTARIAPSKHLEELVSQATRLKEIGFPVYVHGADQHYWTMNKLKEYPDWTYKGAYDYKDRVMILSEARFHFNIYNTRKKSEWARRIELVTAEALDYGCIPITNRASAPDWFNYLVYDDPREIPELVPLWNEFAPELMPHLVNEVNNRSLDTRLPQIMEVLR